MRQVSGSSSMGGQRDSSGSPRIAIGEDGSIAYASPEFCEIAELDFQHAPGTRLSSIMTFTDRLEAEGKNFRDTVGNGAHSVLLGADKQKYIFNSMNQIFQNDIKRYDLSVMVRDRLYLLNNLYLV